ncbi:MAG: ribosomal protein L31E [Roseivirga sp.]|jgi:ribosomal protein L31E
MEQLVIIKKFLLISLIFTLNSFLLSCKDYRKEDTQEILKVLLEKYEVTCLNEKMWASTIKNPEQLISSYYNWIYTRPANSLLVKNIIDVIPKEEIIQMKGKYSNKLWGEGTWKPDKAVNVIVSFSECKEKESVNISEPLFTSDFEKALIYFQTESCNGTSSVISILQKVDDEWQFVGSVPISIGDKFNKSDCN